MIYIQQMMTEYNISQYKLAEKIGIDQSRISQIVNSKSIPSKKEGEILEKWFLQPIDELLKEVKDDSET